jgi:soluble lytic murein transglycosylase-like protein
VFASLLMRRLLLLAVLGAATTVRADTIFSAADVPGAGIHKAGPVVISNDRRAITAYHFNGNIREALVSLKSARVFAYRPFSAALFDSSAALRSPVPPQVASLLVEASQTHGIDARLLAAVASRESAWNPHAVSAAGACGLMQLMPATARYLGIANVFDARENVLGGARYLRALLDAFHGDLDLTLAAYNAGPGAVQRYGGVPPYRETRAYVTAVRAAYEHSLARN